MTSEGHGASHFKRPRDVKGLQGFSSLRNSLLFGAFELPARNLRITVFCLSNLSDTSVH